MSSVDAIDLPVLRARLEHALRLDVQHDGSLYLRALACCYLAVDEDSPSEEHELERLFYAQAKAEGVEADSALLALSLLSGKPGGEP